MNKRNISRILIVGVLFAFVMVGANAMAQAARPTTPPTTQQGQGHQKAVQNAAEHNPACQKIVEECKKLGFIVGEWKVDNGLWKDCFDPVVKGGTPTRDHKPIQVPVSSSEVQECRQAVEHHKPGAQQVKPGTQPKL